MFADELGPFAGRTVQLADTRCRPLPLQGAALPIVVGGGGERRTLRLVAEHADACNLIADAGIDEVRHKLAVLDHWCAVVGRDPATVERTVLWTGDPFDGTFEALAGDLHELGVTTVTLVSRGDHAAFAARVGRELSPRLP
jgi:alkanesulfonate monooxygenase SsuD/methylene tetrahydromethanopterin reductase-like flavin-dependent oxidoreductase (luciferase family)